MSAPPVDGRRTALVLAVPEAEPLVAAFRARHDAASVARRVPPHVTVLFPFVTSAELDDEARSDVRDHAARLAPFAGALTHVGSFPEAVWLAPAPRDRFVALIRATYARYPACPPYGGEHPEPEPHLTVARPDGRAGIAELVAAAERELGPWLPLRIAVRQLTLLAEGSDGSWAAAATFPLAGS